MNLQHYIIFILGSFFSFSCAMENVGCAKYPNNGDVYHQALIAACHTYVAHFSMNYPDRFDVNQYVDRRLPFEKQSVSSLEKQIKLFTTDWPLPPLSVHKQKKNTLTDLIQLSTVVTSYFKSFSRAKPGSPTAGGYSASARPYAELFLQRYSWLSDQDKMELSSCLLKNVKAFCELNMVDTCRQSIGKGCPSIIQIFESELEKYQTEKIVVRPTSTKPVGLKTFLQAVQSSIPKSKELVAAIKKVPVEPPKSVPISVVKSVVITPESPKPGKPSLKTTISKSKRTKFRAKAKITPKKIKKKKVSLLPVLQALFEQDTVDANVLKDLVAKGGLTEVLKKAENGDKACMYLAGSILYELGHDKKSATQWLQHAYDNGRINVRRKLVDLYLEGHGSLKRKKSIKKGLSLLEECAQDSIKDRLLLAEILLVGTTPKDEWLFQKNYKKVAQLLNVPELKNNPEALYLLAEVFVQEHSKGLNYSEMVQARLLFQAAINAGEDKRAQGRCAFFDKKIKYYDTCNKLLKEIPTIQVNTKNELDQVSPLVQLFKQGNDFKSDTVCARVFDAFKKFEHLESFIEAANQLYALRSEDSKSAAIGLANFVVNKFFSQKLDEVTARANGNDCSSVFSTQVIAELIKEKIVPLFDAAIKEGDLTALETKAVWLQVKLLSARGTTGVNCCFEESGAFAEILMKSKSSPVLKGRFLHCLGKAYMDNFKSSGSKWSFSTAIKHFEQAYKKYNHYESGKYYAESLARQAKYLTHSDVKKSKKWWGKALAVFKDCADPEKGNNLNIQGLLAENYYYGKEGSFACGYIEKDDRLALKYSKLAVGQKSFLGCKIAGLLSVKTDKKASLILLLLAMKDKNNLDVLPMAIALKRQLEPRSKIAKLYMDFVQSLAQMKFAMAVKSVLAIVRTAPLDNNVFKDSLANIVVQSAMQSLGEVVVDPKKGQGLYGETFSPDTCKRLAKRQLEVLGKALKDRGIFLDL